MFTKRIGTGAFALLAALLLGASGLAGCATDEDEFVEEPVTGDREAYDEDFYGGRFEEEARPGQGAETTEPFGERYDSGPWGGQEEAYGEPGTGAGETGMGETTTREGTRNPFDRDYY